MTKTTIIIMTSGGKKKLVGPSGQGLALPSLGVGVGNFFSWVAVAPPFSEFGFGIPSLSGSWPDPNPEKEGEKWPILHQEKEGSWLSQKLH